MPNRKSEAQWEGNLKDGKGTMRLGSGAYEGSYTFASRFEDGKGTNPEELIAAAHAGCFSMALSHGLALAGFTPTSVRTSATVRLDATFQKHAADAKENCPVSKLVKQGTKVTLQARLEG
jgi:osmotically inducible protein OsmC